MALICIFPIDDAFSFDLCVSKSVIELAGEGSASNGATLSSLKQGQKLSRRQGHKEQEDNETRRYKQKKTMRQGVMKQRKRKEEPGGKKIMRQGYAKKRKKNNKEY